MAATALYLYSAIIPPFGSMDSGDPGVVPVGELAQVADLGAHEGKALLIVAAPFDPAGGASTPGPLPFGAIEGAIANTFETTGTTTTIYPAATHGASSLPGDTPSNTYIPASFTGEIQTQLSLFTGADPLQPGQAGIGELQLIDPAGELDALLGYGWEGALIELRRGLPTDMFSTWSTVAKLASAGLISDLKTKSLRLRSLTWILENAELHGARYTGAGGETGDPTLAGRLKPYAAGYVYNITPVVINSTALIAQVSNSSVSAISAVYDGRSALTLGVDYATYALLAAATVAPGTYATCLAFGLFRLGTTPVYGITCDVQGDADTVAGLPGPTTRGRIVRRIATGLGVVRLRDHDQIDFAAFQGFENKQAAPCGWYWDGSNPISKAEAITEVMAGVCGWWLMRPNGQLSIGLIEDPTLLAPSITFEYPATGAGEVRLGDPVITDTLPPRRATFIGWRRNYTIQDPSQLAGTTSQADALIYNQPSRYAGSFDQWSANNYPTSPAVYLFGNFRDEVDALAEQQRQAMIFSVPHARYAIPIIMDPLADIVGQPVAFANLGRLGWGTSKPALACGINAAGSVVELHVWAASLPAAIDPDARAWALATGASDALRAIVSTFIRSLKAAGVWDLLDRMWLRATATTTQARTDLVKRAISREVGSPVFTAWQGIKGDVASTGYIDTDFTPSTDARHLSRNSATIGFYFRNDRRAGADYSHGIADRAGTNNDLAASLWYSDGFGYSLVNSSNAGGALYTPPPTLAGMWVLSRIDNTVSTYKDGSLFNETVDASVPVPPGKFYICAVNVSGVAQEIAPDEVACDFLAGGMTAAQATALSNAVNAYMTAIGRNVY